MVREVYERKVEAIDTDIYVKLKQVGEEMRRELKDTEHYRKAYKGACFIG